MKKFFAWLFALTCFSSISTGIYSQQYGSVSYGVMFGIISWYLFNSLAEEKKKAKSEKSFKSRNQLIRDAKRIQLLRSKYWLGLSQDQFNEAMKPLSTLLDLRKENLLTYDELNTKVLASDKVLNTLFLDSNRNYKNLKESHSQGLINDKELSEKTKVIAESMNSYTQSEILLPLELESILGQWVSPLNSLLIHRSANNPKVFHVEFERDSIFYSGYIKYLKDEKTHLTIIGDLSDGGLGKKKTSKLVLDLKIYLVTSERLLVTIDKSTSQLVKMDLDVA